MTPTARSLKHLRSLGYHAYVVERWNPYAKVRQDFGGFADILAFCADQRGVLAVQATTGDNVAHRAAKLQNLDVIHAFKLGGNLLVIHGWAKQGARGKRKVWTLREVWL